MVTAKSNIRATDTSCASFEVHKKAGQYYFELRFSKGERVLRGELVWYDALCRAAIQSLREHSRDEQFYTRKTAENGQFYFTVIDKQEILLATSELFWSASSRNYALLTVKRECRGAGI